MLCGSDETGLIRQTQVMQLMSLAGERDGKALKRCVMRMISDLQDDLYGISLDKLALVKLQYN